MRYRPEVDGLRAVSVIPVVLFHAGFNLFRGGYVGVDVFFVISGYLITSNILGDLRDERFSLATFYARRMKRILPALFVVMAVSCIFAGLWMLPKDLESFGKSLIATGVFASNVWELHSGGYWALPAQFKPLLHTWSLAVEEQFYLTYPLLLIVLWTISRGRMVGCLLFMAIASLVTAQAFVSVDGQAVFYLLPMRAWELLLGALVAFRPNDEVRDSGLGSRLLDAAGLAMIAVSVVLFDRRTPSGALPTLLPACGAALVLLFASERTIVGRLLAMPALVTVGLMSYSLYLWHYPVFAFARIYYVETPGPYRLGAMLLGIVPVAYLSWRFVEMPFRNKARFGQTAVFATAAALSFAFVASGYALYRARGIPSRLYPDAIALSDDQYIEYNAAAFRFKKDAFQRPDAHHVLVLGNSFARDVINMTVETFDLRNVELVYRDDVAECLARPQRPVTASLLEAADVIVFANRSVAYGCVEDDIAFAAARSKKLFYMGTKYFGVNLNWLMRLDPPDRRGQFNPLPDGVLREEATMAGIVPRDHYVSILTPIVENGRVPITDAQGRLISPDRTHLTRDGARFVGRKALTDSPYGVLLKSF